MKGGGSFAFADLWSTWRSPDGGDITTVVLAETDLSGLGGSDAEIIQAMLDNGNLNAA